MTDQEIRVLKEGIDLVSLVGHFTELKKRGAEWVGRCVAHDDSDPSMWVVPQKGLVHCFSCGFSADAIGFIQETEGLDFKAAIERLGGKVEWKPRIRARPATEKRPERITSKPPTDTPTPNMRTRELGDPSRIWPYRDSDGGILGYVARYETEGGKQIRCWTWGARGAQAPSWGCGHWNKPRPLYGLDKLAARPAAPVLVVEGEKAADAAQALLPAYAVVTWPGGSQSWSKADLEPLRARQCLLWPDNDEAGIECMQKLAAILADPRGLACQVKVIDPNRMPDGFDAADWTGTTDELIAWAKPRASVYEYAAPISAPQGGVGAEPPPPLAAPPADAGLPPVEFPPEATLTIKPARKNRQKPRLASVDGNTALAPEADDEPLPQAMSEDALADAFADLYGESWRFVKPWGAWFEWDGEGWRKDETAKVDRLAVQITRQALYWPEAANMTPKERRQVNKRSTAGAVRDLAATDRRIAATMDGWDADSWLMGVPGGVIDLRLSKMVAAEPGQYITKRTAVAPAAGTPKLWLEYMARCHSGDEEIIAYLRRYAGYCCTGETGEHAMAFMYGTGRNGKGVFLETVSRILGDYAKTASINTFLEQKNPAHSTELARLHKARLVITEEASAGGKWNESRIKHMTGGGKITARFMRMDDFEFTPNFKLLVASNHKPSLRSVDEAIKARIHLVPFTVTIPPEERDPNLLEKLRDEWPQILAWMLEGCAEWQERGLTPPQRILDATTEYMQSEDILGDWLDARCAMEGECDGADAYQNYNKWCDEQGHSAWSRIGWSRALMERGTIDSRRSAGRTVLIGMSIKSSV